MRTLRRRFWGESALALTCAVLAAITPFWRDWLEGLTGLDPDRHNGAVEWLVVAALAVCFVAVGLAARSEWRRARPALATTV
jgi:hypothetical protein